MRCYEVTRMELVEARMLLARARWVLVEWDRLRLGWLRG